MVYRDRQYKMVKVEQELNPNPKLLGIESTADENIQVLTVIDSWQFIVTVKIEHGNEHRCMEIHNIKG